MKLLTAFQLQSSLMYPNNDIFRRSGGVRTYQRTINRNTEKYRKSMYRGVLIPLFMEEKTNHNEEEQFHHSNASKPDHHDTQSRRYHQ